MIMEIKGRSDIGLKFQDLVLDRFFNKGFNFAILQDWFNFAILPRKVGLLEPSQCF